MNSKFETWREFKLLAQVQTLRHSDAINKDKQANNFVFQDFLSLATIVIETLKHICERKLRLQNAYNHQKKQTAGP